MPKKRPTSRPTVTKLPPNEPAARDEGPRLLPLDIRSEVPALDHYLELADIALGTDPPLPRKKPRRPA